MAVTTTYYSETWHGTYSGGDISLLLSRATDVVNNAIYLSGKTVDDFDTAGAMQTAVYNAVCAQTDFIINCGGVDYMSDSGAESVSLGKFSYSGSSSDAAVSPCELCEQGRGYLLPTGLLYKGVSV